MKKNLQCIILTVILCLTAGLVSAQYPPDTILVKKDLPTGIPMPDYLDTITDPTFNTIITRITDETVFGTPSGGSNDWWNPFRRHRWYKNTPWNADGSLIHIDQTFPAYLVDGNTNKLIKRYDPSNIAKHPPGEAIWSNIDPNMMYGHGSGDNTFMKYDVAASIRIPVRTFDDYSTITIGNWEGNISMDDKYAALYCVKGEVNDVVIYNILQDSIEATFNMGEHGVNAYVQGPGINWVTMSLTGKYFVILWQLTGENTTNAVSYMGCEVFDRKTTDYVRQVYHDVENGTIMDVGLDSEGNDIVVYQDHLNGDLWTCRLDDGVRTKVLSGSKVSQAITISCRNTKRPGWAYISDFNVSEIDIPSYARGMNDPSKPSYNNLFALKLDGSEIVERFACTHQSANANLYCHPDAVPNQTGDKVIFSSVWENDDLSVAYPGGPFKTARIYDYVVQYVASIPNSIPAFVTENIKVNVYPNPIIDHSTVTINLAKADNITVSIIDLMGRTIMTRQFYGTTNEIIELDAFKGKTIYFLKVINSKNQIVIKKLIQQ